MSDVGACTPRLAASGTPRFCALAEVWILPPNATYVAELLEQKEDMVISKMPAKGLTKIMKVLDLQLYS